MPAGECAGAGLGNPISHMPTIRPDKVIPSDLSDQHDVPLYTEIDIDKVAYAHVTRRFGIAEGEPGTSVSAFNSSI